MRQQDLELKVLALGHIAKFCLEKIKIKNINKPMNTKKFRHSLFSAYMAVGRV
jgi:hypothetical protein